MQIVVQINRRRRTTRAVSVTFSYGEFCFVLFRLTSRQNRLVRMHYVLYPRLQHDLWVNCLSCLDELHYLHYQVKTVEIWNQYSVSRPSWEDYLLTDKVCNFLHESCYSRFVVNYFLHKNLSSVANPSRSERDVCSETPLWDETPLFINDTDSICLTCSFVSINSDQCQDRVVH